MRPASAPRGRPRRPCGHSAAATGRAVPGTHNFRPAPDAALVGGPRQYPQFSPDRTVRLLPRNEQFFDLLAQLTKELTTSARLLDELFAAPERIADYVTAIKAVEHEADGTTHQIIKRLDESFITPLDREDIHLLANRLDNVVDLLDGTARRVAMFRVTAVRPPARRFTNVLMRTTAAIEVAVGQIRDRKFVHDQTNIIKQLEEEGDAVYHEAVGALFDGAVDPLEVMKWKDIYDTLEDAIDECEDVANVLASIALKNG